MRKSLNGMWKLWIWVCQKALLNECQYSKNKNIQKICKEGNEKSSKSLGF
jgi:hypothetical protein